MFHIIFRSFLFPYGFYISELGTQIRAPKVAFFIFLDILFSRLVSYSAQTSFSSLCVRPIFASYALTGNWVFTLVAFTWPALSPKKKTGRSEAPAAAQQTNTARPLDILPDGVQSPPVPIEADAKEAAFQKMFLEKKKRFRWCVMP
jgi:hypothetical protein